MFPLGSLGQHSLTPPTALTNRHGRFLDIYLFEKRPHVRCINVFQAFVCPSHVKKIDMIGGPLYEHLKEPMLIFNPYLLKK